jgi:hypothetical protein
MLNRETLPLEDNSRMFKSLKVCNFVVKRREEQKRIMQYVCTSIQYLNIQDISFNNSVIAVTLKKLWEKIIEQFCTKQRLGV